MNGSQASPTRMVRDRRRGLLAALGATLALAAGDPEAMAATKTFSGASGGTWATAANWTPAGVPTSADDVVMSGKTITLDAPAVAASLTTTGGAISGASTLDVGAGASSVTNTAFNLASVTTFTGGTLAWSGADVVNPGTIVHLQGTTTISTTNQNAISNSGTLINDGALSITAQADFTSNGSGKFRNNPSGTVTVDPGDVTIGFGPDLENQGSMSILSGRLDVNNNDLPDSPGSFAVASGATLGVAASGTFGLASGGSITGAGTAAVLNSTLTVPAGAQLAIGRLRFAGGAMTIGADATAGSISTSGTFAVRSGAGKLDVGAGASTADGLTFQGGGTTVFAAGSVVAWNDVDVTAAGTLVKLLGTTTISTATPNRVQLGATLRNEGTFNVTADATFPTNGTATLLNAAGGTMTFASPSIGIAAKLENAGTLSVTSGSTGAGGGFTQTAGSTTIAGGAALTGTATLQGGTVTGGGTLGGNVTNTGATIAPGASPGTLTIGGAYTQGAGGTLQVEITGTAPGGDPGFDRLLVTGAATLAGTAQVLLGGGFTPLPGDLFAVVSAASLTGNFGAVSAPPVGGRAWLSTTTPTSAVLGLGAPPPAPTNTTAPSVTGTPAAGQTLTCEQGAWTGDPASFAIQWLRDGAAIPGATGAQYAVTAADQGTALTCRVTATNAGGDGVATSAAVSVPAPPASTPTPTPTPTPTTTAAPKPVAITTIATLPPAKACVSRRRFPIRLRGVKSGKIVRAQIKLNGKQVRTVKGKALGLPIDLRGLPKGRFTVEIITTDAAGKKLVGRRTYRTCVPKRS